TSSADCSGSQSVAVTAATPVLPVPFVSSISPTTMTADGALHLLTINGSGFQSGNVVQFYWTVGSGAGTWNTSSQSASIGSNQITFYLNPGTLSDTHSFPTRRSSDLTSSADCSGSQSVAVTAAAPMLPVPFVSSI